MTNTVPLLCSNCGQPLISIKFKHHYCLVCDNAKERCHLFRGTQFIMPRDGEEPREKLKETSSEHVYRPNYEVTKELMNENYRYARSLGIPAITARDFRCKSREEIEKAAKAIV